MHQQLLRVLTPPVALPFQQEAKQEDCSSSVRGLASRYSQLLLALQVGMYLQHTHTNIVLLR